MDNGDNGEISCKELNPSYLSVGGELTYTIESTQYGNKIKRVTAQNGGFKGGGAPRAAPKEQEQAKYPSFAVSYAKDLWVAGKIDGHQFLPTAEKILKWLKENSI